MSLPVGFSGIHYRLSQEWNDFVPLDEFRDKPIKYLEIGTLAGANLLTVESSYASHPESELYCVDPWENYDGYDEYLDRQNENYKNFLHNINLIENKDKIKVRRGYSHTEVKKFDDEFFDIIYIDANHKQEYVLEDAILTFRKVKKNGIIVFDDYGEETKVGIDAFLSIFDKKISVLGKTGQVFLRKIDNM
jgi:hypothetical protein